MTIAVLANEAQKQEWLSKPAGGATIVWANSLEQLMAADAHAYFDLLFEQERHDIRTLAAMTAPVFINAVVARLIDSEHTAAGVEEAQLIRINAWPGFLQRELTEVVVADPFEESAVREVFNALGWKYRLVPDVPGMISARIISAIVNEAYFTLQAGVSTRDEIDTAMKLGTNYPLGPFEWSRKIGLQNICALLTELGKTDKRYQPCEELEKECH